MAMIRCRVSSNRSILCSICFCVFDLFIHCVFLIFYINIFFYISLLVVRVLTSYSVYLSNCFVVATLNKRFIMTSRKVGQGLKVFHQCPKVGIRPLSHATGLLHTNLLIKITMYISGVSTSHRPQKQRIIDIYI